MRNAVESSCRSEYVIRFLHFDEGLPKLFQECFDEHVKMSHQSSVGPIALSMCCYRGFPLLGAEICDIDGCG